MINLFRSKIFYRQFFYFFLIICITFFTISAVLLSTTKSSLEKQETYVAENYRIQVSKSIRGWLMDKEYDIKNQALYISQLDESKLSSPQTQNVIKEQLGWSGNFLDILIINSSGYVINTPDPKSAPNLSSRDYFINGMQGKSTITGFYGGAKKGSPIMAMAVPVYIEGRPKYVLAAIIGLDTVAQIVESQRFGNWGHAYLVDSEGMFITNSTFIKGFVNGIEDKDKYKISSLAVSEVLNKKEGTGSYLDFTGEKVFGSYEWMEPLQAGLIVEFKAQKVMKPLSDLMAVIGVLGLFILVLGAILAYLFSRKIVTPLGVLINGAENIISRNYHNTISIRTNTELDVLVDTFNNMQQAISSREERLNEINNELRIQTDEAVKANKLKSQFLAAMSHELRTPLNSIIGFTNRVIKKCTSLLPVEQQENLNIVKQQAEKLLMLINGLLNYSKIEAGKMTLCKQEFNMVDAIEDAYNTALVHIGEKPLSFERHLYNESSIPIFSDRGMVYQIFVNLLSNAFKYSDQGVVSLTICRCQKYYVITIDDQGIGIAKENLVNIFDEFYQVDGSDSRKVEGTGLGLAITKKLVEMLDGRIEVASTLGTGSCFAVYIPANID